MALSSTPTTEDPKQLLGVRSRVSISDYVLEDNTGYDDIVTRIMNDLSALDQISSSADKKALATKTLREIQALTLKRYSLQSKIGQSGAGTLICLLAKEYLGDDDVTIEILKTIDVLITNDNNNKCIFAENGAILHLVQVVKQRPENIYVLSHCYKSILDITNSKLRTSIQGGLTPKKLQSSSFSGSYVDTKIILGEEGICEASMNKLEYCCRQIQEPESRLIASTYKDLIISINQVIASLAACSQNLAKFGESTSICTTFMSIMEAYKDECWETRNLSMWKSWLWAIINLCTDGRYFNKEKFGFGTIEFIFRSLQLFAENLEDNMASCEETSKFIEYSCWSIHNLCLNCDLNLAELIRSLTYGKDLLKQIIRVDDMVQMTFNAKAKASSLLELIRDGEKRAVICLLPDLDEEKNGEDEQKDEPKRGGVIVVKGGKIVNDGTCCGDGNGDSGDKLDVFLTEEGSVQ